MKSKFWAYIGFFVLSIVLGFLVAYGTGILTSPENAMHLPGGSFSAGMGTAFAAEFILRPKSIVSSYLLVLNMSVAGICGWLLYIAFFM